MTLIRTRDQSLLYKYNVLFCHGNQFRFRGLRFTIFAIFKLFFNVFITYCYFRFLCCLNVVNNVIKFVYTKIHVLGPTPQCPVVVECWISVCHIFLPLYDAIAKTCLYNVDPLKPHFYIIKLGFTGVCYISYLYSKT